MQARKLKKILGNPGYAIHQSKGSICVGSSMCHDLITINPKDGDMKYALAYKVSDHRDSLKSDLLIKIWDTLKELFNSGDLKEIWNNNDVIKNKIEIFYEKDGEIIETHTDEYGWPNTTFDGVLMYNDEFFKTRKKALENAISEFSYRCESGAERVEHLEREFKETKARLSTAKTQLKLFKKELGDIENTNKNERSCL